MLRLVGSTPTDDIRRCAGTGIQARLRPECHRMACEFDSHRRHKIGQVTGIGIPTELKIQCLRVRISPWLFTFQVACRAAARRVEGPVMDRRWKECARRPVDATVNSPN